MAHSLIPTLFLVRHGETALNDPKATRMRGWYDVELSAKGKEEAKVAGIKLAHSGVTKILASDLHRTTETGRIIARLLGTRVIQEYGLRTWHCGVLTGQLEDVVRPLVDFYVRHPFVAVPGGESYANHIDRLKHTILKCRDWVLKHPDDPLILVTHQANILITDFLLNGKEVGVKDPEEDELSVKPGEVLAVCFSTPSSFKIVRL